jgi:hypothetical protein
MLLTSEDRNLIDPVACIKIATSNGIVAFPDDSSVFPKNSLPLCCLPTSLIVVLYLVTSNKLWFVVSITVAFTLAIIVAKDTSDAMQNCADTHINVCLLFIILAVIGINAESYTYILIYQHTMRVYVHGLWRDLMTRVCLLKH